MPEKLIILLQFKDGIYPEIAQEAEISENKEIKEIKNFFDDILSRANKFKEKEGYYPETIEGLQGWEELN